MPSNNIGVATKTVELNGKSKHMMKWKAQLFYKGFVYKNLPFK